MRIKTILIWIAGYEILSWFLVWMTNRAPWVDPMDGSTRPTFGGTVVSGHISALIVVVTILVFIEIFKRVWRASNRRR